MKRPAAICVADRFAGLRTHLLELLGELSREDWDRGTVAGSWSVKDVVSHLLGGDIGILSRRRDAFSLPGRHIHGYEQLVELVNRLNDEWVRAAGRMSPRVLGELLEFTGPRVEAIFLLSIFLQSASR